MNIRQHWTDEENKFLIEYHDSASMNFLLERLSHGATAIRGQLKRLGLNRNKLAYPCDVDLEDIKIAYDWPNYLVTRDGQIWSGRTRRWLKHYVNYNGYPTVHLHNIDIHRIATADIHKLVCIAFHGQKPFESAEIRHLDGNPCNNHAANLAWGTAVENAADKKRHGTYYHGETHHSAIYTADTIKKIRADFANGERQKDIARKYGMGPGYVSAIILRKVWVNT